MLSDSMGTCDESTYDAAFKAAVDIIQSMPKKGVISISVNQKLLFYSLFKQGTHGKCDVPCPPLWHTVDRMKWRAWDNLGSMHPLEAKKLYVAELRKIIDCAVHEYNIEELAKESDEQTKKLLVEKLHVLGYDISSLEKDRNLDDCRRQSCNVTVGSYDMMKKHNNISGTSEFSDQCSESSASTAEYVDAVCCNDDESREWLPFFLPDFRFRKPENVHATICEDNHENIRLLLAKIDNLEQIKGEVSETLLNVVDKRIAYPRMITSHVSEAGKYRMKRVEEAELIWPTESTGKKEVEKMLEIINKVSEAEKENEAFVHRLEELKKQNDGLEKVVKGNDEIIRKSFNNY